MPPNLDYQNVCGYLKSLNIHFSERWVLESINNLKSANSGISINDLRKGVYERWLSTNLRDFNVGSFPPNLLSYEKITLSGTYAVQVESMVNSARSCYSELQRIENRGNCDNITDKSDKDANSKRCLTFRLYDGVQEVQGMEYHFIPNIRLNDPNFLPGFKMIIKGPVVCRKGMLLLKQENVQVCGGKVDILCETNNLAKLLRARLGLGSNNEENNTDQIRNETNHHPAAQSTEVTQPQATDNITSNEIMEVDELLSQNDDILMNLSFEPGFENERNNSSRQNTEIEENNIQVQKKPRIDGYDGIAMQESNKVQVKNKSTSLLERHPSLAASSVSQNESAFNETGFGSYSGSNSNSNRINSSAQCHFSNDDDIIIEDEFIQSQSVPKRNLSQTTGKCTQMKMSSFITNVKKPNTSSGFAGTSSNNVEEETTKNVMSYPFVYLKQLTDILLTKPTTFTVKAIILTLKSKIGIKNDEFALKACISDGSYTMQVNFSSETLEDILEYSPCEVTSMMSVKSKNSAVAEKLKGVFLSAQQKLLSMNCLMKIKFFSDGAIPLVVGLEEIQLEHVNALKARSC